MRTKSIYAHISFLYSLWKNIQTLVDEMSTYKYYTIITQYSILYQCHNTHYNTLKDCLSTVTIRVWYNDFYKCYNIRS